jgi:hypothetical protein
MRGEAGRAPHGKAVRGFPFCGIKVQPTVLSSTRGGLLCPYQNRPRWDASPYKVPTILLEKGEDNLQGQYQHFVDVIHALAPSSPYELHPSVCPLERILGFGPAVWGLVAVPKSEHLKFGDLLRDRQPSFVGVPPKAHHMLRDGNARPALYARPEAAR